MNKKGLVKSCREAKIWISQELLQDLLNAPLDKEPVWEQDFEDRVYVDVEEYRWFLKRGVALDQFVADWLFTPAPRAGKVRVRARRGAILIEKIDS